MLYTRKGDNGTTKLFDCSQGKRISKDSFVFEVLGALDELNSSLGYAKVLSDKSNDTVFMALRVVPYREIIEIFQQRLFCIQAEVGGSKIYVTPDDVLFLENVIYEIETVLPPITSFIVSGGGESGAYLDVVRTITRRTERLVGILKHTKERIICEQSLTYLNRLSSVLYALARFANYQEGYTEKKPHYV